jgi:hypothetical protein
MEHGDNVLRQITQKLGDHAAYAMAWLAKKSKAIAAKAMAAWHRVVALVGLILFLSRHRAALWGARSLAALTRIGVACIATLISLPIALWALFALTEVSKAQNFPQLEVHLASAGIIGTALALILTLSIIPAQRAAEAFSTAILRLYARDRSTHVIFALLTLLTVLSILVGTGAFAKSWAPVLLATQVVFVGIALDALRAFYNRTLSLLVPGTALGLVLNECTSYIRKLEKEARWTAKYHRLRAGKGEQIDDASLQWLVYRIPALTSPVIEWISQLEEFGHKAIERRDTQAARETVITLTRIGTTYANGRRESLVLIPDFAGVIPVAVSDVGNVLNPIYESLKRLLENAAKQSNESIAIGCIRAFGSMATFAMSMRHTDQHGLRSLPLAFAPVHYLDSSVTRTTAAGMSDALLEIVRALSAVLSQISAEVHSAEVEAQAIDTLSRISLDAYKSQHPLVGFAAVELMLRAARHEISIRGFDQPSILSSVLPKLAAVIPLEVQMELAKRRIMQTFPAYSLGFDSNLPAQLREAERKVVVDPDRRWVNPFNEFNEVSQEIVRHFRDISEAVDFQGTLLQKWMFDSIMMLATIHIEILTTPPEGVGEHIESVDEQLRWIIGCPQFFFDQNRSFHPRFSEELSARLAASAIKLLRLERVESASACVRTIQSTLARALSNEPENMWNAADIAQHLEVVARAAVALGRQGIADESRVIASTPAGVEGARLERYTRTREQRGQQLDERLARNDRGLLARD